MAVVKATAEDLERDARDYFTRHRGDADQGVDGDPAVGREGLLV